MAGENWLQKEKGSSAAGAPCLYPHENQSADLLSPLLMS